MNADERRSARSGCKEALRVNETRSWTDMLPGFGGLVGGLIGCKCGFAIAWIWYVGLGVEIVQHRENASLIRAAIIGIGVAFAGTAIGCSSGFLLSRLIRAVQRAWQRGAI